LKGPSMYTIRAVKTLEEFKGLSEKWSALLKEAASDSIFLTWEWLYTWARYYLEDHRLLVLLVYAENDRLVGIAPLYIRKVRSFGFLNLREIRFLGTEEVCSSYLDFIVTEKDKKEVLGEIYRYLYGDLRDLWDTLTLSEIPAESSSIDVWNGVVQDAGKVIEVAGMTSCPVISVTGSLEDFLAGIGGTERYNLQRKQKRLERAGTATYRRASAAREVESAMEVFIRLHQIRWEQKGSGGAFQSRRFLMFHREIARIFSEKEWVFLDFLLLDGVEIAGIYGYRYHGRYLYYLPGFNPNVLPKASHGILLLFRWIETAIREGCRQIDLLQGLDDYKMAWANGLRRSLTLRCYNRNLRAAVFKQMEGVKQTVKILVR
jgi:CelD/BcsL family acetyltransferase involved in cellulose biosynthesis